MTKVSFSDRVLAWFDHHGRRELPWQHPINPYRVWVSEIMLQQTQVATVIPYFERFVARFPHVAALARASEDEVLHLWTGLGYYARARNLHRAAQLILNEHGGELPVAALETLPGIGRSTAGAIRAIAFGQRAAILDGNVKRILARHGAVDGWPGTAKTAATLWQLAEARTPDHRAGDYAQAMMDLGATLCTRAAPHCDRCPVAADCRARRAGAQTDYPARRPRRARPQRTTRFLLLRRQGAILLQRRPPAGVWGGLYCAVECPDTAQPEDFCATRLGLKTVPAVCLETISHAFSHFDLRIQPLLIEVIGETDTIAEATETLWYDLADPPEVGLPAPMRELLEQLPGD